MNPVKHVLLPTDFHEPAARALKAAIELAMRFEANLTVLHVWEMPETCSYAYAGPFCGAVDMWTPLAEAAARELETTMVRVHEQLASARSLLLNGRAHEKILSAVHSTGADLVVMGTHGRTGLNRVILGSVAEKIVRLSPTPVLIVRQRT